MLQVQKGYFTDLSNICTCTRKKAGECCLCGGHQYSSLYCVHAKVSISILFMIMSKYCIIIIIIMKHFNRHNSHSHHGSKCHKLVQHAHSHGSHAFTRTHQHSYNHMVWSASSAIIFQLLLLYVTILQSLNVIELELVKNTQCSYLSFRCSCDVNIWSRSLKGVKVKSYVDVNHRANFEKYHFKVEWSLKFYLQFCLSDTSVTFTSQAKATEPGLKVLSSMEVIFMQSEICHHHCLSAKAN